MGDNRKFDISGIFSPVLLIVDVRELTLINDPSLSVHGYQLLSLATSELMGNDREFDVSAIIREILLIFW